MRVKIIGKIDIYINELYTKVETVEQTKRLVKECFYDKEINDNEFNDFIYNFIYNKLKEFGIEFDLKNENYYEEILKENY